MNNNMYSVLFYQLNVYYMFDVHGGNTKCPNSQLLATGQVSIDVSMTSLICIFAVHSVWDHGQV